MIFAAVGTQLPFPRLFNALEPIARRNGYDVIAQTGDPAYTSDVIKAEPYMSPLRFEELMSQSTVVVAHAGIGLIIAATAHNKPIILVPRRAALKEHRNDHQLATTRRFAGRPGITIAHDEAEMEKAIADYYANPEVLASRELQKRQDLISALKKEIAVG